MNDVDVGPFSSTSYIVKPTGVYDFMKTNEEMASSMVKEQLTHFMLKKVINEEAKNPSEWWKMHEVQFSYVGFVSWQKNLIVGSQIEVEKVFSVASICTNLQCFQLGIEKFEMPINIYKNWLNDVHIKGLVSMKQFMNMEEALMEENKGLIDQLGFLDIKENGNKL